MKLSAKTAQKIAARYDVSKDWTGKSDFDKALSEVIRRNRNFGGLMGLLTEEARRDLILTLGDNRRSSNAFNASQRARFAAMRAAAE